MTPPAVVYIAGAGHSGSTLLAVLLGAAPDALALGEVSKLVGRAALAGEPCGCGEQLATCPFWRPLWNLLDLPANGRELGRLAGDLAGATRLRAWPALRGDPPHGARFETWARHERRLWAALGRVHPEVKIVVDSSKTAGRAFALSRLPERELRIVHLVRDPRAVAWSYRRRELATTTPQSWWSTATRTVIGWRIANRAIRRLAHERLTHAPLLLRYEDLVHDPRATLSALGNEVGLDLGLIAERFTAGDSFPTGHLIAGNRLRLVPFLERRPDQAWRSQQPRRELRLATALAGSELARYGYDRTLA